MGLEEGLIEEDIGSEEGLIEESEEKLDV